MEKLFSIDLRHIKSFNDEKLLSLNAKSKFKIIHLGVYVLRIDFFFIYYKTTTKNVSKILQ